VCSGWVLVLTGSYCNSDGWNGEDDDGGAEFRSFIFRGLIVL
jgi:hypothetical protein